MCHNDANKTTPPFLTLCVTSRFSTKFSFLKNLSNVSDRKKKVNYILDEPLNLHIIVGSVFFSSAVDSRRWRKWSLAEETIQFEQQTNVGGTILKTQ